MKTQQYRIAIGYLCLVIGSGLSADPTPEQVKRNAKFYADRAGVHARVNGVNLGTTVTLSSDSGREPRSDVLQIEWTLSYSGPRHPFSILKPTLEGNGLQTCVILYAEGTDGQIYEYCLEASRFFGATGLRDKSTFLTLDKGKDGTGTISVPVGPLRQYFTKQ